MKHRLLSCLESLEELKDEGEYGDVEYADKKNKKYPIDTEKHVRAAWSYIHMKRNAAKYSEDELKVIKNNIRKAAKKFDIEIKDEAALEELYASIEKLKESSDTVQMSVPLFIRFLEYSREDAKSDEDLHFTTERLIKACEGGKVATMDEYYKITDTVEKNDK